MSDLLPCPLCGRHAALEQYECKDWYVRCENCSLEKYNNSSRESAIKAWNTRALAAHREAVPVAIPADALSDFWREIYPNGMSHKKVLDELHDLEIAAVEVPKVYDHVTGGRLSKVNTAAKHVIAAHDDIRERDIEEALQEALPPAPAAEQTGGA